MACLGVDGDDGCLRLGEAVFVGVIVRQMAQGADGSVLFVGIHGRVDLQAFFIKRIVAVLLGDLLRYIVDEGGVFVLFFGRLMALREA